MKAKPFAIAALICLTFVGTSLADVIWVGGGRGKGLKQEVDILGAEGGELIYLLYGNRVTTPLERVQQIQMDKQPQLTEAETQFAAGQWQAAATAYERAMKSSNESWVKRRSAERLVKSAAAGGQFDKAVAGYVELAELDPVAAIGNEPEISAQTKPEQLQAAGRLIQGAVGSVQPQQQKVLLSLLMQIQNQLGDEQAAAQTSDRLMTALGSNPDQLNERDGQLYSRLLLGRARLAMNQGKLAEAEKIVEDNRQRFTQADQQSDALLVLADLTRANSDGSRDKLFDAAVAYMKIVAHFKDVPNAPNVATALLRVAEIHVEAGEPAMADKVYRELIESYPDSDAARTARERVTS